MVRRSRADCLRSIVEHLPKLIRAAADYAEGKGAPPEEILIWNDWQFCGLPPEAGGLNDQPAGLIDRIRAVLDIVQAIRLKQRDGSEAGSMAAWKNEHPREARIIRLVEEARQHGLD